MTVVRNMPLEVGKKVVTNHMPLVVVVEGAEEVLVAVAFNMDFTKAITTLHPLCMLQRTRFQLRQPIRNTLEVPSNLRVVIEAKGCSLYQMEIMAEHLELIRLGQAKCLLYRHGLTLLLLMTIRWRSLRALCHGRHKWSPLPLSNESSNNCEFLDYPIFFLFSHTN